MWISLRLAASGRHAVSQVESSSACGAPLKGEIGTPEMPFIMTHCSSTGRNASSDGGGEERKLSGVVGQNWSMITPCGMYMKPRRTGGLYAVLPLRTSAQPMVSNSGRARLAPRPLKQVRRLIRDLLLMAWLMRLDPAPG